MTKDYTDFYKTQTQKPNVTEIYVTTEWNDEFYGLPDYREYYETWC